MNDLLSEKSLRVRLTESATEHLAEVGYDPKMGARPLARKINDLIKVPLSKKILFENVPVNSIIEVNWTGEEFTFDVFDTFIPNAPMIDSNGYIVLDQVQS
jgi:ATP-dependent Clp protease ATP-binding subunit ClpA